LEGCTAVSSTWYHWPVAGLQNSPTNEGFSGVDTL
jgi:hypothetical protein